MIGRVIIFLSNWKNWKKLCDLAILEPIRKSGMKEFKNLDVQMFVESIGKLIGGR